MYSKWIFNLHTNGQSRGFIMTEKNEGLNAAIDKCNDERQKQIKEKLKVDIKAQTNLEILIPRYLKESENTDVQNALKVYAEHIENEIKTHLIDEKPNSDSNTWGTQVLLERSTLRVVEKNLIVKKQAIESLLHKFQSNAGGALSRTEKGIIASYRRDLRIINEQLTKIGKINARNRHTCIT